MHTMEVILNDLPAKFQYHPGSINAIKPKSTIVGVQGFQYHPGSINAEVELPAESFDYDKFQYHPGSINA